VHVRQLLAQIAVGLLIIMTALMAVGLVSPEDRAFSIQVHPVLLRLDPAAIAQSRARALGVDVDIRIGGLHVHLGWSALPFSAMTTNSAGESL
jgi:hypothetical protein